MKEYLAPEVAERILETLPTLMYPNQEANVAEFSLISPKYDEIKQKEIPTAAPSRLIGEAIGFIGKEPKKIIDVGSGTSKDSLYLASHGHYVTAIDHNPNSLDLAMDRAELLGISRKNFTAKFGDIRDLTADDKCDVAISTMALHFVEEHFALKALKAIQDMAVIGGLNVVSVYTENNPDGERTHRYVKYLFKENELSISYMRGWEKIRDVEGYSRKPLERDIFIKETKVLIAHMGEIIAKKTLNLAPIRFAPRQYMNANRQIIDLE